MVHRFPVRSSHVSASFVNSLRNVLGNICGRYVWRERLGFTNVLDILSFLVKLFYKCHFSIISCWILIDKS